MRSATMLWILVLGLCLGAIACDDSDDGDSDGVVNGYNFQPILQETTDTVIIGTYKNLFDAASDLADTVAVMQNDDDLVTAQEKWTEARVFWEQSEAFLFGPVADYGLDPALDSWPVDRVQLDQVLASSLELTPDSISENLGGGLKGFHTIEYLLFGVDQTRSASELVDDARMKEYLDAVTESFRNDTETLYKAWASGSEDDGYEGFGETFYLAGQEGGRYYSQVDAMQQLVNGCVDIADEVANGKIADPYDEQSTELVESQFSFNSIQDFADNIRSIQMIYEGSNGSKCLSTYIAEKNATLDEQVKTEIQAAIDAVLEIHTPFRDAITDPDQAAKIEAAQAAIRTVMDSFSGPVMSTLYE